MKETIKSRFHPLKRITVRSVVHGGVHNYYPAVVYRHGSLVNWEETQVESQGSYGACLVVVCSHFVKALQIHVCLDMTQRE